MSPRRAVPYDPDAGVETPSPSTHAPWLRVVGTAGWSFLTTGVLIVLFVVYQLWGTGLQEAASQHDLRGQFSAQLSSTTSEPATTTTPPTTGATATTAVAPSTTIAPTTIAPPTVALATVSRNDGDPVARLEIPKIGVDKIVVAGTSVEDLKKGPGLYVGTPLPGHVGNTSIAGHRTTFGAPFYRVNELAAGDTIRLTTVQGVFTYTVTGQLIVAPTDVAVVAPTTDAELTLTSCNPRYSASQRIVIKAKLDESTRTAITNTASPPTTAPPPPSPSTPSTTPVTDQAPTTAVADPATVGPPEPLLADTFTAGWFSDAGAWPHVAAWALGLVAIALGVWQLGRRLRHRWLAPLAAFVPFIVVLYFFYENVARLLPPNI